MYSRGHLQSIRNVLLGAAVAALVAATLSGCIAIAVGGVATGAVVAHDKRTAGSVIEDQSIELKAHEAVNSDPELDEQAHIVVVSYNQIVLVAGQVPTEELRARAIKKISEIQKVRHVNDELTLATPTSFSTRSSDSLITAKVKAKLFGTDSLDASRIKVVTENGTVYLMGLITKTDSDVGAEVASKVGSVQRVVKLFEYVD
jgi:osmotically-inducible protein OsmY